MSSSGTWLLIGIVAAVAIVVGLVAAFENRVIVFDRGKAAGPRVLKPGEIRVSQFPALIDAMLEGRGEPRWAAMIFSAPDRLPSEEAVNLNLSVENGKVGFDWVLLSPRDIEDQEKFKAFARARGMEPAPRSMNGVSYLRVEASDLAAFVAAIVTELYHVSPDEPLGLTYEGFEWPQEGRP